MGFAASSSDNADLRHYFPTYKEIRKPETKFSGTSSPTIPRPPLHRFQPDLRTRIRHACPLIPIAFFIANPRWFSFNSPRKRKKSRGIQVLGIVGALLSLDVGVIPTWRTWGFAHCYPLIGSYVYRPSWIFIYFHSHTPMNVC